MPATVTSLGDPICAVCRKLFLAAGSPDLDKLPTKCGTDVHFGCYYSHKIQCEVCQLADQNIPDADSYVFNLNSSACPNPSFQQAANQFFNNSHSTAEALNPCVSNDSEPDEDGRVKATQPRLRSLSSQTFEFEHSKSSFLNNQKCNPATNQFFDVQTNSSSKFADKTVDA